MLHDASSLLVGDVITIFLELDVVAVAIKAIIFFGESSFFQHSRVVGHRARII